MLTSNDTPTPAWSPIARRRLLLGLTQEQVAEQVGRKRVTIVQLEAGRSWPSPLVIAALAEVYGAEPAEICQDLLGEWYRVHSEEPSHA